MQLVKFLPVKRVLVPALMATASLVCLAATPIARVVSSESIEVNGIAAPGGNFVPVSIGGSVVSKGANALVQFQDGAKITLAPNSKLRIDGQSKHPIASLVSGSATYDIASTSSVHVAGMGGSTLNAAGVRATSSVAGRVAADSPVAAGYVYRASAGAVQSGVMLPSAAVSTGTFGEGGLLVQQALTGTNPTITLPNGTQLVLQLDATSGTYSVSTVQIPVISTSGNTVYIPVANTAIQSTKVTITTVTNGTGGATTGNVLINFTNTATNTVVDPVVAAADVNKKATDTVTAAIANKTIASTSTAPTLTPISNQGFSSTAP